MIDCAARKEYSCTCSTVCLARANQNLRNGSGGRRRSFVVGDLKRRVCHESLFPSNVFCINIKRREPFLECGGLTPLFALHGQMLYDATYPLRRKRNRAADCRQGKLSASRCRKRLDAIRIGG